MSQISQVINIKPLKAAGLWLPVAFVSFTGGILVLMIFTTLAYQVIYLHRVYPGVFVAGIDAGGMTQPELMAAVSERAPKYLSRSITIEANGESWTFTGQELGMRIDVAATASEAYAVGRQGNLLADVFTHLTLITTPRQIDPLILYDTGPSNQVLQRLASQINQPPQDARLTIHPDARIEVIPARRGRRLHIDATRSAIEAALFDNTHQPVQAVVQQIIPAIADVEKARQQADNLLGAPLVFGFSTGTDAAQWRLEPETVAGLIDVVKKVDGNGKTRLMVEPNRDKFAPFFEQFAKAINQEPVDARLEFDDKNGQLTVLRESVEGRTLEVEAAYQRLLALTENPSHYVELPILVTPPAVSSKNIESLGIKELVSESTSYFKGSSEGRVHNIALATSRFHGVVIPPGGIFSFNRYLGKVTKENGFDESLIIYGDRTTVGIGGGICQVSTTAFRAAFLGGFEIVERWAHGYRVSWYEINSQPGLDATIYTPEVDFKFRNDTDHYLLIQTKTDEESGTATFRFYGTKTNREVIVSEPELANLVRHGPPIYEKDPTLPRGVIKQVDWAKDGLDVTVTRTVKEGDRVIHEDVIFSHYRPWQAVYKVGTGEEVATRR